MHSATKPLFLQLKHASLILFAVIFNKFKNYSFFNKAILILSASEINIVVIF